MRRIIKNGIHKRINQVGIRLAGELNRLLRYAALLDPGIAPGNAGQSPTRELRGDTGAEPFVYKGSY